MNMATITNDRQMLDDLISLIKYSAFGGSIKCFKYLLINGADNELKDNIMNYAIAGGNI